MRILITNDDGIEAPGLDVLQQIASELSDDVWVVAPETDQSGAAHALSLHEPLRLRQLAEQTFAVKGTPTDCAIMGVRHLMSDDPPDLVLSGVNHGQNIADDVNYSGTIAGAVEGMLLGIRSVALSLAVNYAERGPAQWQTPMQHGAGILRTLLDQGWDEDVVMNINFPARAPEEVEGVMATRQGKRNTALLHIEDRVDMRGKPYYWFGFQRRKQEPQEGTDIWAIDKGYVSVTPLALEFTHEASWKALQKVFG